MSLLGILLLMTAVSWLLAGGVRRWLERREIYDIPNHRSSHTRPTTRGGGLAIVAVTLAGWSLYSWSQSETGPPPWPYVLGGGLIAAISWWDDLRDLPSAVRFAVHGVAAAIAIAAYGYWETAVLPGIGAWKIGSFGMLVAFLWITGLTNVYNFMDGIDGIAGGQAALAGLGWFVVGLLIESPPVSVVGILVASSSLGFLQHNWPPAKIFMGDVGSAFLGYTFAVLPLLAGVHKPSLLITAALLVWPFLFDSGFTLLARLARHENIFAAHRSHLYQRLVALGYRHRTVTLLYLGLALLGGALAIFGIWEPGWGAVLISTVVPACSVGLWLGVRQAELQAADGDTAMMRVTTSSSQLIVPGAADQDHSPSRRQPHRTARL